MATGTPRKQRQSGAVGRFLRLVGAVFLVIWIGGCANQALYNDPSYNPPVYWGSHRVSAGETLYSIAWRYGRDYRELADANGLKSPYSIRKGQVIRLDRVGVIRDTPDAVTPARVPARAPTKSSAQAPQKASPKASSARPAPKPVPKATKPTVATGSGPILWQWPNRGTVIAEFSEKGNVNKGIDIAGKLGGPVLAAADGEVVYAGTGLLGYGKLLIVNHNERFLSAYAHNDVVLVKEGAKVKVGQTIAKMGSSGTNRVMLHFEIRRDGKPVNPRQYLPK